MIKNIPRHIEQFWKEFLNSDRCPANAQSLFQTTYQIGANKEDADHGSTLILTGQKTATSSLIWEFEINNEALPSIGDLCVIENGKGEPVCVVETIWVETIPFAKVDAKFAKEYAEADGTLEDWKKVFGKYYAGVCLSLGKEFTPDTLLVCERFRVIYP